MKDISGGETLESMSQAVWYNKWTMEKLVPFIRGEILEVGCGIGNFTKDLTKYGEVWAIDINKDYLNQLNKTSGFKVGFGDIELGKYFFNSKQFDTVVCLNVLEHIKHDNQALKNLYRLLKKDGTLVLLIPSHRFLFGEIDRNIGHFRRYEKSDILNELKKIGFIVSKSRRLNILGAFGWFVAGKFLKSNVVESKQIKVFNLLAPFFLGIEDFVEPPIGTSILIIAKR